MSKLHSYEEIAIDFELWAEYVDPDATMTEKDFENMTVKEKVEMQIEIFEEDEYTEDA